MSNEFTGVTIVSDLAVEGDSAVMTICVSGDFDSTQVERFDRAIEMRSDDVTSVRVDLSECTVLDSAALGALIRLRQHLDETDRRLVTVADKPFQRQILANTGLGDYLGAD